MGLSSCASISEPAPEPAKPAPIEVRTVAENSNVRGAATPKPMTEALSQAAKPPLYPAASEPSPIPPTGRAPLQQFTLEGRISFRTTQQSLSGGVRWERVGERDSLVFTAPMGGAAGALWRDGTQVEWTDDQGQRRVLANGLAGLDGALGFRLPLEALPWWLAGLPQPGGAAHAVLDGAGRLASLTQDGWRVELQRYRPEGRQTLPSKIIVKRGPALADLNVGEGAMAAMPPGANEAMEMRLVIDRWSFP